MTGGQKFLYFVCVIGIMAALAIVEYFVLGTIISIFTSSWFAHTIIICLTVIFINPVLCKMIMEKIPFKAKNLKNQKIKKTRSDHNIKA